MQLIDKVKSVLKSDDVLPTLSVFPEIDQEKLRRDLDLDAQGEQRGKRNLPAADTKLADNVEANIISRIEALRRTGLENYENSRQIYNERLSRAGGLRKDVEFVAHNASADYLTAVRGWRAAMTGSTERLYETFQHRKDFRERHSLKRPAKRFEGWLKLGLVTVIFVGVEAALNAVMFSRGNEQGLVGGLLTALIFSAVNVIGSLMLGIAACGLNHSAWARKLFGFLAFLIWVILAAALNLTVAHFRDLIDAEIGWSEAVRMAIPALQSDPFGLTSMDSWFLLAIGSLISIVACLKGWNTFDPLPGYSRVERDLQLARAQHQEDFDEAVEELTIKREKAIDELRDADQQVRDGISQAIDALYGHSTLNSHLKSFLAQCDTKLAYLLAVYRDANISVRTEPKPPSFSISHAFPTFETAVLADESRRAAAETEADKVTAAVDAAVREIFQSFRTAVEEFALPEEVQQGQTTASVGPRSEEAV
ncbi:hypothetical protein LZ189_03205 [Rhodovulum sulfidophilum]|nr:hypothetical protein [Rhodovulum sulfidophilum]